MNNNQDFNELRKALHMLAQVLIQEGKITQDRNKWFLGNALGTILVASESKKDIEKLSPHFQKFCDAKRKEMEDLEEIIRTINETPANEMPGITELLGGTGVCLN